MAIKGLKQNKLFKCKLSHCSNTGPQHGIINKSREFIIFSEKLSSWLKNPEQNHICKLL